MRSNKAHEIWRKAEIHRKACQIGRPDSSQPFELCECCDQIIHTEPMGTCEHSKEFVMFGYGYSLWFSFLKHCMLLVFVLIISKTATEIYIATQENYEFCYGVKQIVKHPIKQGIMPELQTSFQPELSLRHEKDNHRMLLSEQSPKVHNQRQKHYQSHELLMMLDKDKQSAESVDANQTSQLSNTINRSRRYNLGTGMMQGQPINPTGQRQCTSVLVYLAYFKQQKLIKDWFLTTIEFLALLVALIYFRNTILKEEQQYNEDSCLISDYTIVVRNLPPVKGLRQSVLNLFEKRFYKFCGGPNPQIRQAIYIFQDDDLKNMTENKIKLQNELIDAEKQQDDRKIQQKGAQLQKLTQLIDVKAQQVRQQIDRDEITCDKILITMSTEIDRVQVLEQFKKDQSNQKSYQQFFNIPSNIQHRNRDYLFSTEIMINAARQPNEIVWDNIDANEKTRKIRSLIGWFCTAVVLAIATLVFYFIIKGKTKLVLHAVENQYENSRLPTIFKLVALLIVIVALIGIVIFNKVILQQILRFIVHQQKHGYRDKQNLSFAVKYASAIFFTTGLMTLIVQAISYQNFYTHHLGLIQEQSLMFFVVALLIPLILWIHPYNKYKNWKREKVYGTLMRQQEANQMMEDYPYDMSKKYSQVFKLMWLTFLYAELIPLGSFLTLFGLMFYFWVDKYNFVNSCTCKPGISGKMTLLAVKSIDATLFMVPGGSFLFDLILRGNFNVLSLVLMILGIIYLFLPMSDIIWILNDEKFQLQKKRYDEVQFSFRETYLSMHPVYSLTHKREIQMHRQMVKEYYKAEIKKQKFYGVRKGTYYKEEPGNRKIITAFD